MEDLQWICHNNREQILLRFLTFLGLAYTCTLIGETRFLNIVVISGYIFANTPRYLSEFTSLSSFNHISGVLNSFGLKLYRGKIS